MGRLFVRGNWSYGSGWEIPERLHRIRKEIRRRNPGEHQQFRDGKEKESEIVDKRHTREHDTWNTV